MYYVTIGKEKETEEVLYYPSDSESAIFETELTQSIGEVGTFKFKVPYTNAFYNSIKEYEIITIYRDDLEYWRGFVREVNMDFNKNLEVYCIEDFGYLALCMMGIPFQRNISKPQMYKQIIQYFNGLDGIKGTSRVFEENGYINNNSSGVYVPFETTYEMTLLDALRSLCGDEFYLKVRRENGKRFLDCLRLENYGKSSDQDIYFGDNLLDYTKRLDTSDMINVILPYGDDLEDEEIYEGYSKKLTGTMLANNESITKYGRIEKAVFFETDDLKTLNSEAEKYMKAHAKPHLTLELTAVDMSELSVDYQKLRIGDKVQVFAEPFGFNGEDAFPIISMVTNLQDLSANNLVLSDTMEKLQTLTEIQGQVVAELENFPTESALLNLARKNAMALLDNSEGGYLSFEFNENNQIVALHIADDKDLDNALNEWKWGIGGLGFRTRTATNQAWQDVRVALTNDGHIVADKIFAAIISGDNTLAGKINVGGSNYGHSGAIKVYDKNNKPIITIDETGIILTNQMKIRWEDVAHPAIPADISDLTDKKKKLWTTTIANTWIQTTEIFSKQLISTLLFYDSNNYVNFGRSDRTINGQSYNLPYWMNVQSASDCFRIDNIARTSANRFIAASNGNPDATSGRIEYTGSGQKIVSSGREYMWDAKYVWDLIYGTSNPAYASQLQQLIAWAKSPQQQIPFSPNL